MQPLLFIILCLWVVYSSQRFLPFSIKIVTNDNNRILIELPRRNISINLIFPSMKVPTISLFRKPMAESSWLFPVVRRNSTERNLSDIGLITLSRIYSEESSTDFITLPKIYIDDMHQVIMMFQ